MIKKLNENVINLISSGQTIFSLENVLKELLENAYDAQSSSIDFGMTSIEISDNGIGIDYSEVPLIIQRHNTSKIDYFSDLENIKSFGFRGEALNSLCEISESLVVISNSRENNYENSVKICFENGKIASQNIFPRERGTTIILNKIFTNTPVRRKELSKNIRKEFNKILAMLQRYALIPNGVKLRCINSNLGNRMQNLRESVAFSTEGSKSLLKNIEMLFGPTCAKNLLEFNETWAGINISFFGYLSSALKGNGKSDSVSQYFYINNRPVFITKIKKLINEIYRKHNPNQYPFVCLFFSLKSGEYDINVNPNKDLVYIQNFEKILTQLEISLITLWEKEYSNVNSVTQNNKNNISSSQQKQTTLTQYIDNDCVQSSDQQKMSNCMINIVSEGEKTANSPKRPFDVKLNQVFCVPKRRQTNVTSPATKLAQMFGIYTGKTSPHNSPTIENVKVKIDDNDNIIIPEAEKDNIFSDQGSNSKKPWELQKASFSQMKIIGQFNHGFIVTQIESHLYIIDQHASDERFNYEKFQKKFCPFKDSDDDSQNNEDKNNSNAGCNNVNFINHKLIKPIPLPNLTHENIAWIKDYLDIFKCVGFEFITHDDAIMKLTSTCSFMLEGSLINLGEPDLLELIDEIKREEIFLQPYDEDVTTDLVNKLRSKELKKRLKQFIFTSVRRVLASKACRTSIMIGKALNKMQMERVVKNLSALNHPWICAHGRPTVNHLYSINKL